MVTLHRHLSALGIVTFFIGWAVLLVVAWQKTVLWGVLVFLVPVIGLVFALANWKNSKTGAYWELTGVAFLFLAAVSK